MPRKEHTYHVTVKWTGNSGTGTSSYQGYERAHEIRVPGKPVVPGTSDPAFRGQPGRYSPEELFVASLSACHQLWYLHLCADAGIVVVAYEDTTEGIMEVNPDGSGQFVRVILHPRVTVTSRSDVEEALTLHRSAHQNCFLASSVNFPVECKAHVDVEVEVETD
jgi:organic hydroperoxide reductase OsmC/OhrA